MPSPTILRFSRRSVFERLLASGTIGLTRSAIGALALPALASKTNAQIEFLSWSWIAGKLADAAWQHVFGTSTIAVLGDKLSEVQESIDSAINRVMIDIKKYIHDEIEHEALLRIQGDIQGAFIDLISYEAAPAQTAYRLNAADTKCTSAIGEARLHGDAAIPALTIATNVRLIALIGTYRLYRDAGELVNIGRMVLDNGSVLLNHLNNIIWRADVAELTDMHSHDRRPLIYKKTALMGEDVCRNYYEVPGELDWNFSRTPPLQIPKIDYEDGQCGTSEMYQKALKERKSSMDFMQGKVDAVMAPYVTPSLEILKTWTKIASLGPSDFR